MNTLSYQEELLIRNSMFSLTKLIQLANKIRGNNNMSPYSVSNYMKYGQTIKLIGDIKKEYQIKDVVYMSRGRYGASWIHKTLFMNLAFKIYPHVVIDIDKYQQGKEIHNPCSQYIIDVLFNLKPYKCIKCGELFDSDRELLCHELNTHKFTFEPIKTNEFNGSKGELKVYDVLKNLDIYFTREVCDVKNNEDNWLRFDFKLLINKKPCYIEYDGRQHFEPVCFGGIPHNEAIEQLKRTQEHDNIKNKYCQDNGFPLLRIRYDEYDHIRTMILKFLHDNTSFGTE